MSKQTWRQSLAGSMASWTGEKHCVVIAADQATFCYDLKRALLRMAPYVQDFSLTKKAAKTLSAAQGLDWIVDRL